MKQYVITKPEGVSSVQLTDAEAPKPAKGEVLVKIKANSLNFRDTIVIKGGYPRNDVFPTVPLSDMAGEVIDVGEGVTKWKKGDRVMANFMRDWIAGPIRDEYLDSSYGGGINGFLTEEAVVPEKTLVRIPSHLSFEEAATLPCAALTAWNALTANNLKAGDTVLLLGTGGVSIFALQFAKAFGARVIITSSSDEKLERAKKLGADETVNYKTHPEWHEEVLKLTDGKGVDQVVEVGGPGTLERSLQAVRSGGSIGLIGLLNLPEEEPSVLPVLLKAIKMQGIYVGSVEMFEAMNKAIEQNKIKPIVDQTYKFEDAQEAYRALKGQGHFGKIVVGR